LHSTAEEASVGLVVGWCGSFRGCPETVSVEEVVGWRGGFRGCPETVSGEVVVGWRGGFRGGSYPLQEVVGRPATAVDVVRSRTVHRRRRSPDAAGARPAGRQAVR
jgi:hypothetical protein